MRARKYPVPDKIGTVEKDEGYITASEAADYLRTTMSGIYSLVSRGKIPSYKPFGQLLFRKSELDLCVKSSKKKGFYNGS